MFNRVQLGPYAERLRACILADDPRGVEDYALALSRFDATPGEVGILNSDRADGEGVNHYRICLGGYMAIVKVTNKKPPAFLEGLYIVPENDVLVIILDSHVACLGVVRRDLVVRDIRICGPIPL